MHYRTKIDWNKKARIYRDSRYREFEERERTLPTCTFIYLAISQSAYAIGTRVPRRVHCIPSTTRANIGSFQRWKQSFSCYIKVHRKPPAHGGEEETAKTVLLRVRYCRAINLISFQSASRLAGWPTDRPTGLPAVRQKRISFFDRALRARSERPLHRNAASSCFPSRAADCKLQSATCCKRDEEDRRETSEGKEEEEEENGVGAVQAVARSAILALGRARALESRLSGGAESREGRGRPAVSRDNSSDALRFFVCRTRARVTRHAYGRRDASIATRRKADAALLIERRRIHRSDVLKIPRSSTVRSRACVPVGDSELSRWQLTRDVTFLHVRDVGREFRAGYVNDDERRLSAVVE